MTLTQETLGSRLRDARGNVRMSQEAAAAAVGLDRTALAKIETGARSVTGLELIRLARLYRRDPADFFSDEPLQEDPFTVLGRIAENVTPEWNAQTTHYLELLKEAVRLEEALGDRIRSVPPTYQLPVPTSFEAAVEQGKDLAVRERERLKIGCSPIADIAELIAEQGIWTAAVPFPDDVSGLFIAHNRYGLAIFVNQDHGPARRRFSYAHEYAHTLTDRNRREPEPTSTANRNDFIEKRANAFASEFLIPEAGVYETLERMRKGGPSRASSWILDAATNEFEHHETRVDATAHRISPHDVALLAHEFKVSYEAAAIRLKDIDAVRKNQLDELLHHKEEGRRLQRTLKLFEPDVEAEEKDQPFLARQVVLLALEAFRRGNISGGRFREVCNLADYPYEDLLPVAMAGMAE